MAFFNDQPALACLISAGIIAGLLCAGMAFLCSRPQIIPASTSQTAPTPTFPKVVHVAHVVDLKPTFDLSTFSNPNIKVEKEKIAAQILFDHYQGYLKAIETWLSQVPQNHSWGTFSKEANQIISFTQACATQQSNIRELMIFLQTTDNLKKINERTHTPQWVKECQSSLQTQFETLLQQLTPASAPASPNP